MKLNRILPGLKQNILRGTIIVCACAYSFVVNGQSSDINFSVSASDIIDVCGGNVTFTVDIENISGIELSGLVFNPNMPMGMVYDPATISTIASLPAGATRTISFEAHADCRLMDYVKNKGTYVSTMNYTKSGTAYVANASNGFGSYTINYPIIELTMRVDADKHITPVNSDDIVNRHFQVKNSGAISLTELVLKIENNPEVEFSSLVMTDQYGNSLGALTYTSKENNNYIYTITTFNGNNTFEPNEVIYFTDAARTTASNVVVETHYIAQWGCDGSICNNNDLNAEQTVYIDIPLAIPIISYLNYNITQRVDIEQGIPYKSSFLISNNGSTTMGSRINAIYDVQIEYQMANGYGLINYLVLPGNTDYPNGFLLVNSFAPANGRNYVYNIHGLFQTDPDGVGGLSDLDGDGWFDDLEAGNNIQILNEISILSDKTIEGCNSSDFYENFTVNINYLDWNKNSGTQSIWVTLNNFRQTNNTFLGVPDLDPEEIGIFTYKFEGYFSSYSINLNDAKTVFKLTVPEGYELLSSSRTEGSAGYDFEKIDNYYLIDVPGQAFPSQIQFEVQKHCIAGQPENEMVQLESHYYFDKDFPNNFLRYACNSYAVINHCEACTGLKTTNFAAKRTTLGWKIPADGHNYTYDEMYGSGKEANKVTEGTAGLRLNAAYPKDIIHVVLDGEVNADATHGLHAKITYDVPLAYSSNMLEYQSNGVFILDGQSYPLTGLPNITRSGNTYTFDFDINAGNASIVTIQTGSVFQFVADFKFIPVNIVRGDYLLNNFRGRFEGINSIEEAQSCLGYGVNFYLLKPLFQPQPWQESYLSCSNRIAVANPYYEYNSVNYSPNSTVDFPNEYRPIAYLESMSIALPTGVVFNPENREISIDGINLNDAIYNSSFPSDNRFEYRRNNASKIATPYNVLNYSMYLYAYVATTAEFVPPLVDELDPVYRAFNINSEIYEYAYIDNTSEHQLHQVTQVNSLNVNTMPKVELLGSKVQDGNNQNIEWPIRFCHTLMSDIYYNEVAHNSWVAVELKADDGNVILTDATGELIDRTFYNSNRAMLIQLGTVNLNTCKTLNIKASYLKCLENVEQPLDIYGGWSCSAPVSVPSTPTSLSVISKISDELVLRYKSGDLVAPQIDKANASQVVNYDSPVAIEITLQAANSGYLNTLGITSELPSYLQLVAGSCYYKYNGVTGVIPVTPDLLVGNQLYVNVSSLLPDGELHGTDEPGRDFITVGLTFIPEIGFDPGIPLGFNVSAKTKCDVQKSYHSEYKLLINGVSDETITVSLSGTPYTSCVNPGNSNTITLLLTNQMNYIAESNKLHITLSDNIMFNGWISGLSGLPESTIPDVENKVVTYTFALPENYFDPSETKVLSFRTVLKSNNSGYYMAYYNVSTSITNPPDKLTTGFDELELDLLNIFPLVDITGYNLASPVCKGTRVRLKANPSLEGDMNGSHFTYLWQPDNQDKQTAVYNIDASMKAIVTVTAQNGCQSTEGKYLSVLNVPNPLSDVEIKGALDCSVPSGSLSIVHTPGNTYQWIKDGTDIVGPEAHEPVLNITSSGLYRVYVENNSCGTSSDEINVDFDSESSDLKISLLPTGLVETGYNVIATVSPWTIGTVYTWRWGDGMSKPSVWPTGNHSYSSAGTYTISVSSGSMFVCAHSRNTVQIEVVKSICSSTITADNDADFYLDNNSGRIVFRSPSCSNEIDFGCISGTAKNLNLRRAVKASAVTYSDQWAYCDDDFDQLGGIPQNANAFDIGKLGKWRPNASFVYYNDITLGSKNYNSGTFKLEAFNYKYPDCNNTNRWVRSNASEYYSPAGTMLQSRDAIGVPSSEKYGYKNAVVYMSAVNAEKEDIFFESFENTYSIDKYQYFEDFMRYDPSQIAIDTRYVHAGNQSAILLDGSAGLITRSFSFSNQVLQKGLLVNCWVRVDDVTAESQIILNMHAKLIDEAGRQLVSAPFKIVAHVGDWFLVESEFSSQNLLGLSESSWYIPAIYFSSKLRMNIDDIRIQPANTKSTAYVFDPATLKVLTIFDEQLFGLYHQYSQEGKLIRKQVETEKGKYTIQETFYNEPKKVDEP